MAGGLIRGVVGQVKWGYHNAAAIDGYTVSRDKATKRFSLVGTVVLSDSFKLKQKPLRFVAPFVTKDGKPSAWEWLITEFELQGGVMRARLEEFPSR